MVLILRAHSMIGAVRVAWGDCIVFAGCAGWMGAHLGRELGGHKT